MLVWLAAGFLTLCACLAVLAPMLRPRAPGVDPHAQDVAVYRDQLAEVERDRARGLIGDAEAEEARAEIGRRILKLADAEATMSRRPTAARMGALSVVALVPLASWGLYTALGSPGVADQPLSARLSADPQGNTIEELVARAERHLIDNPSDGNGWAVLAPIYLRLGRTAEAVTAYRNAIRLNGPDATREAGLGEALMAISGGVVTADARAAFQRAVALDASEPKAGYYLAAAAAQDGRTDEAVAGWTAMLERLPADSSWRGPVEQAIAVARAEAADAAPGPDQADLDAAAQMSPEERAEMIEGMVARLDERLRDDPSDSEGWLRLVRSYMMLEKRAEAQAAHDRAKAALAGDAEALEALSDLAATLGLSRTN